MISSQATNNNDQDVTNNSTTLLGEYDVLCGRNKSAFNNTGNRRFRVAVSVALDCFTKAKSRKEKNTVIKSILKIVKGNGGKFLQYKPNVGLVEVSSKKAHVKVGHALRDMALAARKASGNTKYQPITTAPVSSDMPTPQIQTITISTTQEQPLTTKASQEMDAPSVDPLDVFDSISTTDIDVNEDGDSTDVLQWLVGESNELFNNVDDISPAVTSTEWNRSPSIVIDESTVKWLVGESNDLDINQFTCFSDGFFVPSL